MRLDKYLKISRLLKRRTVAADACTAGKVLLNGKEAKPAANVKAGDTITITFGARRLSVEVLSVPEQARKEDAQLLYREL